MAYDPKENYCTLSPDSILGVKINYACYLHDRQYRNEVINRKTRKQADQDLKNRIYEKLTLSGYKKVGLIVSKLYYIVVRLTGWKVWDN